MAAFGKGVHHHSTDETVTSAPEALTTFIAGAGRSNVLSAVAKSPLIPKDYSYDLACVFTNKALRHISNFCNRCVAVLCVGFKFTLA